MSEPVPAAPASAPDPVEIASRYLVERKLGAGAFGTVYKARDKVLGRMVAIKTIRLEGLAASSASLDELMTRFRREAQVSAQLKHPNIVTIYDIGESAGLSYLAMEFIDGVGLERVVRETGPMALERAASIAAQVADALDYAHRNNVVHRDIKPANIMLEAGDRVKVADFGIARVTDSADHLTATGSLLGTPSYMSPEQARGHELDGRSDLFSVGCVLYEMIAGKRAFRGESITGLIFKVITEDPPPLQELRPDAPDEIVRIVAKAMAKMREGRFQTGRELADALQAFVTAGATPTVRQSEAPTEAISGLEDLVTTRPEPTARAAATRIPARTAVAPAGKGAAASPAAPPAARDTRPAPPPPPAAPARSERPAQAPPSAPPARSERPAAPSPSGTAAQERRGGSGGLLLGVAAGVIVVLAAVLAIAWFAWWKPREAARTAEATPGALDAANTAGLAPPPVEEVVVAPPPADSGGAPQAAGAAESAAAGTAGNEPAAAANSPAGNATGSQAAGPVAAAPTGSQGGSVRAPGGQPSTAAAGPRSAPPAGFPTSDRVAPAEAVPPPGAAAPRPPRPAPRDEPAAPSGDFSHLDDDEALGGGGPGTRGLPQEFRGSGSSSYRVRSRVPPAVAPRERPAVATILHLIAAQEAYNGEHGRYASLQELVRSRSARLDVPVAGNGFERRGYRFDLELEDDGFQVLAAPTGSGGRPFVGDDTGFVRVGLR